MNNPLELSSADQALVSALSEKFRPVLHRYFQRRRLPSGDIEDATQEVFVPLSRRRGLADMADVEGYLFETAPRGTRRASRAQAVFRDISLPDAGCLRRPMRVLASSPTMGRCFSRLSVQSSTKLSGN